MYWCTYISSPPSISTTLSLFRGEEFVPQLKRQVAGVSSFFRTSLRSVFFLSVSLFVLEADIGLKATLILLILFADGEEVSQTRTFSFGLCRFSFCTRDERQKHASTPVCVCRCFCKSGKLTSLFSREASFFSFSVFVRLSFVSVFLSSSLLLLLSLSVCRAD